MRIQSPLDVLDDRLKGIQRETENILQCKIRTQKILVVTNALGLPEKGADLNYSSESHVTLRWSAMRYNRGPTGHWSCGNGMGFAKVMSLPRGYTWEWGDYGSPQKANAAKPPKGFREYVRANLPLFQDLGVQPPYIKKDSGSSIQFR